MTNKNRPARSKSDSADLPDHLDKAGRTTHRLLEQQIASQRAGTSVWIIAFREKGKIKFDEPFMGTLCDMLIRLEETLDIDPVHGPWAAARKNDKGVFDTRFGCNDTLVADAEAQYTKEVTPRIVAAS